jgi:hypothetical protein
MLEKLQPLAEETAARWVRAFDRALASGDDKALAASFLPESHWRKLFGISWQLATFSGNEILCRELSRRASEVGARAFGWIPPHSRPAGRWSPAGKSSKRSYPSTRQTAPASALSG